MTVVGAAVAGRGSSKTGKIEMDGWTGKGVHMQIRSLLLLSWKKRIASRKGVGVSVVANPSNSVEPHRSAVAPPPNKLSGTKTCAGTTNCGWTECPSGCISAICHLPGRRKTTPNKQQPCLTTGRSFVYAQTFHHSLQMETFARITFVALKEEVCFASFFNYHKTSEPNNNKNKERLQTKKRV